MKAINQVNQWSVIMNKIQQEILLNRAEQINTTWHGMLLILNQLFITSQSSMPLKGSGHLSIPKYPRCLKRTQRFYLCFRTLDPFAINTRFPVHLIAIHAEICGLSPDFWSTCDARVARDKRDWRWRNKKHMFSGMACVTFVPDKCLYKDAKSPQNSKLSSGAKWTKNLVRVHI